MRILYIDASEENRNSVRQWLSRHQVDTSANLAEAMSLVSETEYDLVLLDSDVRSCVYKAVEFVGALKGVQTVAVHDLAALANTEAATEEDPIEAIVHHTLASVKPSDESCGCIDPASMLLDVIAKMGAIRRELAEGCR